MVRNIITILFILLRVSCFSQLADIVYGTPLSSTQLNAVSNIPGTFVYVPPAGTILNVGTHILTVTFYPDDSLNYDIVVLTKSITVTPASATLTLSNLTQVYDGTPKPVIVVTSPAGLSGVTVSYNGSPTVPTAAGTYTVLVTLVNSNYTASSVGGTLIISQASVPVLSWAIPAPIPVGTILSAAQLNATANIPGTFSYSIPSGTIMNTVGTFPVTATFTPTDSVNYSIATIQVPVAVYGSPFINYYLGPSIYQNLPNQ